MADFLYFKTDADSLVESLRSYIISINQCPSEKQAERIKQIEGSFSDLNQMIHEIETQYPVWSSEDRKRAQEYIESLKTTQNEFRTQFEDQLESIESRNLLMKGSVQSNIQSTIDRDEKIDQSLASANEIKDLGIGLLNELERQSDVTHKLDSNLSGMVKQIEYGDALVHRLTCGERAKCILLWTVIIVFLIFILVFLYFIIAK